MDSSTTEKIVETNLDYAHIADSPKVLNDEQKVTDESNALTDTRLDVTSDNNSLFLKLQAQPSKKRLRHTESIHSWFLGKVTEIFKDDRYFVAELKDIDSGNINIAEFDIDSAFDDQDEVDLKLFVGASFAFYVTTKHGMGSPQTSAGLEFSSPYIWQEGDNEKLKEMYDKLFPEEPPQIS